MAMEVDTEATIKGKEQLHICTSSDYIVSFDRTENVHNGTRCHIHA